MPSTKTITSSDITTFVTGTTITAAPHNTHMDVLRGHKIPIDASASSGADGSYDLGGSAHRWRNNYASGAEYRTGYSTQTSAYTVTNTDYLIFANASTAAFAITLPAPSSVAGQVIYVKKQGTDYNAVTVQGDTTTSTIDGSVSSALYVPNDAIKIICDGSNWQILERDYRPVVAKAGLASGQTIPSGVWTVLQASTAEYDSVSGFSGGTYEVKVPGRYRMSGGIKWATNGTGRRGTYWNVSGSTWGPALWNVAGSTNQLPTTAFTISLSAGTTFNMAVYQDSGSNLTITADAATFFSLELVGR